MKKIFMIFIAFFILVGNLYSENQVTVFNYIRAESDFQMKAYAMRFGAFGKFVHMRNFYGANVKITVRPNRDTLYSIGIFDLTYPVVITLPEHGKRYMSIQVINEDHSTVFTGNRPGKYYITKECAKTRYVVVGIRIFANANDPEDIRKVNDLQDKIKVEQEKKGTLQLPNWDVAQIKKLRNAISVLGLTVKDSRGMFGDKDKLDPVKHLIGTAVGWGGLPEKEAFYLIKEPKYNDGETPYVLTVKDVPVDAFWSVTVYDKYGFLIDNKKNIYSYNNFTAKKNKDGSITIHFGGNPNQVNYIPITEGWNYIVRLYKPKKELLDGKWKFPEAKPVKK